MGSRPQGHHPHHGHHNQAPQYQHHNSHHAAPAVNSLPHSHHPVMNAMSSPQSHMVNHISAPSQGQTYSNHPHHVHTSSTNNMVHPAASASATAPVHSGSVYGRLANSQVIPNYQPLHVDTSNNILVDRGGGERSPRSGMSPKSSW